MKRIEFIDHTADVIAKVHGRSLEDAFAAAAEALFAVITGEAVISGNADLSFSVDSIDRDGLLVAMLSELIVRHEVDNLVASDFAIALESDSRLTCRCRTERFDRDRHGDGTHVKGVSYHMLEINENTGSDNGSIIQVLFDI